MTLERILGRYSALSDQEKVACLSFLLHEFTVCARAETYVAGSEDVSDPRKLREFNELQHKITAHLRDLTIHSTVRYSDDALIDTILLFGEHLGCERAFLRALDRALDHVTAPVSSRPA